MNKYIYIYHFPIPSFLLVSPTSPSENEITRILWSSLVTSWSHVTKVFETWVYYACWILPRPIPTETVVGNWRPKNDDIDPNRHPNHMRMDESTFHASATGCFKEEWDGRDGNILCWSWIYAHSCAYLWPSTLVILWCMLHIFFLWKGSVVGMDQRYPSVPWVSGRFCWLHSSKLT